MICIFLILSGIKLRYRFIFKLLRLILRLFVLNRYFILYIGSLHRFCIIIRNPLSCHRIKVIILLWNFFARHWIKVIVIFNNFFTGHWIKIIVIFNNFFTGHWIKIIIFSVHIIIPLSDVCTCHISDHTVIINLIISVVRAEIFNCRSDRNFTNVFRRL